MKDEATNPIFSPELIIASNVFLYMLQNYVMPQTEEDHDDAPPHSGRTVCGILNRNFPGKWIERLGPVP
jgi:hypothetical protein